MSNSLQKFNKIKYSIKIQYKELMSMKYSEISLEDFEENISVIFV
jgi:hypothetical protein